MWPLVPETSILWLLIPLLIGLGTGWRAWRGRGSLFRDVIRPRPAMPIARERAAMPLPVTPTFPASARLAAETPVTAVAESRGVIVWTPGAMAAGAVGAAAVAGVAESAPHPSDTSTASNAAVPAAAVADIGDDLTRIDGIGPRLAATLHAMGVERFAQVAAWDAAACERIDHELWGFPGRIAAERWVEQAAALAHEGQIAHGSPEDTAPGA